MSKVQRMVKQTFGVSKGLNAFTIEKKYIVIQATYDGHQNNMNWYQPLLRTSQVSLRLTHSFS